MSMLRPPGELLLALARRLLGDDDLQRIVEPAVADLRFDRRRHLMAGARWRAAHAWLVGGWAVALVIARLHARNRARRAIAAPWWVLVAAVAAALVPLPVLSEAAVSLARAQLMYAVVGLAVAAALATTSPKTLERSAAPLALAVIAMLAAVAGAGEEQGSARRWLSVLGLRLHVATLIAPAWAVAVAGLAASRGRLVGAAAAALGLLVATRDLPSTALYAALALAAAADRRQGASPRREAAARAALALVCAVSVSLAWVREPALAPVAHVDRIFGMLGARGWVWAATAATSLALVGLGAMRVAGSVAEGFRLRAARAIAAHMVLQPLVALATDGPVHLVAYGGSGVVGSMAMVGLIICVGADAPPSPARPAALTRR
jgi:hypothetical protein